MNLATKHSLEASAGLGLPILDLSSLIIELQIGVEITNKGALVSPIHERLLHLVEHGLLDLNHGRDFLLHLILQLLVLECFP